MSTRLVLAAALFAAPGALAQPAEEPIPLPYETFEVAVPHIDLDACPDALAGEGRFCRATLNLEEIHVFAFEDEGEQRLLAVESFPAEALAGALR